MLSDRDFKRRIEILINKLNVGLNNEVINEGKILLKKREDQVIYNLISLAFMNNSEYDKSIELLKSVLKKQPNNIFFLNNLGLSHYKKGDMQKAEEYFKKVLEINPNYINTLNNYGNFKKDLELVNESIDFYLRALKIDNKILVTNYNLASIYQSLGEFKKSIEFYNKVLEINPKFTIADRNIALMTKYNEKNKHFQNMKEKIQKLTLSDQQKLELLFALGKAYDDNDNYKEAFSNIQKANKIKKNITNYKIENDINLFSNIKKKFNDEIELNISSIKKKFIFIVGLPRSGTSLVEQIISSHPEIFGAGELLFLQMIDKEFFKKKSEKKLQDEKDKILEIRDYYIKRTSMIDDNKKYFIDKAPLNFRWIGFIKTMFPNSIIIHCTRNPLENCWSIFKNNFEGSLNFSNDLKDLGIFYKLYKELMVFWKKKYPYEIYDIKYENLILNSEKEIRKLIEFCGIEWSSSCLKYYENPKPIRTVSAFQARQPIYNSSLKKSENYKKFLKNLESYLD
tara:strand:+ start:7451 stop:8983 length:1533 start_codon:yes stop_codon:yes gene_type:complete